MLNLLLMLFLTPPSVNELEQKFLVISPMTLEVSYQTEREIIARKNKRATEQQIKELWEDKTIKAINYYDDKFIYVRRKGSTVLEQYKINQLPLEKIVRRSL